MAKIAKTIAIVHHTYTSYSLVESQLLAYLLGRQEVQEVTLLTNPFIQARDGVSLKSRVQLYRDGKLVKTSWGPAGFGHELIFFLRDIFFTFVYFWRHPVELYFGVDNLNTLTGLLLRRFGKAERVVYYVIDYVPNRFKANWLNRLYHWLDRYCVSQANETWNLSVAMATERAQGGLTTEAASRQRTVPVGTHALKRPVRALKPEYYPELVFLGILSPEQGIELLLEAWPRVLVAVPKARLTVIGSGPLADSVRNSRAPIRFLGYLPEQANVDNYLAAADIGLAPYEIRSDSFKQFTDPGKIKSYLGAGLPIVMTNISAIAQEIKRVGAGKIVTNDVEALVEGIVSLATNSDEYEQAARAAQKLAQGYLWTNIFDTAFELAEKENPSPIFD